MCYSCIAGLLLLSVLQFVALRCPITCIRLIKLIEAVKLIQLIKLFQVGDAVVGDAVVCDAVVGEVIVRDAVVGDAVVGDAVVDDAVVGDAVVGDAVVDDAVVGNAVVGDAVVGDAVVGDVVVGDAVVGDAVVGDAVVGDDVNVSQAVVKILKPSLSAPKFLLGVLYAKPRLNHVSPNVLRMKWEGGWECIQLSTWSSIDPTSHPTPTPPRTGGADGA